MTFDMFHEVSRGHSNSIQETKEVVCSESFSESQSSVSMMACHMSLWLEFLESHLYVVCA